jgi:hypothetical protein
MFVFQLEGEQIPFHVEKHGEKFELNIDEKLKLSFESLDSLFTFANELSQEVELLQEDE